MEFRKAEKKDEHCNAELLAESFIDYPLFTVIENDKNRRKKLIYEFQYINTMLFVQKHCCFIAIENQHIIGVALLKSLKGKQDFLSYLRFGLARLIRKGMLLKALKYLKLVTSTNDTLHKRSNNGWYLDSLAISKEVQGKGMGSTILKGCIYPYISKEGGGVVLLATNTEMNRKFYLKNGFNECKEEELSLGREKVKNWSYCMQITSPH